LPTNPFAAAKAAKAATAAKAAIDRYTMADDDTPGVGRSPLKSPPPLRQLAAMTRFGNINI
jgi:hypothetical protein